MRALVVVTPLLLAGCPQPDLPTAEDTAAYLGLTIGKTTTFAIDENVDETHELTQSSILSQDGLVFEHIAKQNGFLTAGTQERTFALEVDADSAQIVRQNDCIVECGELDQPITLFTVPLDEGGQQETDVVVTKSTNGQPAGTIEESHSILVGTQGPVSVPAGQFEGFQLSWRRTRGEETVTALLVVVPDVGIVSWDGFDGAELRLTTP